MSNLDPTESPLPRRRITAVKRPTFAQTIGIIAQGFTVLSQGALHLLRQFWADKRVQAAAPFVTSLGFHFVVISMGLLVFKTLPLIQAVTQEQIIIPDTNLVENADNGGVRNPGINDDPTRSALQNLDERVTQSPDWSNKKSDTLNANLVSGSADVQQNITPIGAGANVGGSMSGLNTRGVGEASGKLAPFGPSAGGGSGKGEGMFKLPGGNVKRVVYVCDASGSMFGTLQTLLDIKIKTSVANLQRSQAFNIVFFREDKPAVLNEGQLLLANEANKSKAYEFLQNYTKGGRTNVIPAIQAAFAMRPRPELIFLLTDGAIESPDEVTALLKKLNADRKTRIHTILFVDRVVNEDESKTLREIAKDHGGTDSAYQLIRASDLMQ
jgi:hypothetical protein